MLPSPSRPNELGRFTTGIPSVMTSVTPRAAPIVPSVAMNGLIFSRVMSAEFSSPQAAPPSIAPATLRTSE